MMPFLSFLIFFALYAGAAAPSFGTDGGAQLLAAAAANGVPPPPAQTLTWLLAKICLLIPFGNPAYRTALAAAALMAGTVPLVAGLLARLSPVQAPAPFADQELERVRWLATVRWFAAFLWGLSPGPWRCALSLGPETTGLFLSVLAFHAAAAPVRSAFPLATFLATLAVGQWPVAAALVPGLLLVSARKPVAPPFSPPWLWRAAAHGGAVLLGLLPVAGVLLFPSGAAFTEGLTRARWFRHALTCPPFFPPDRGADLPGAWPLLSPLLAAFTLLGAPLWAWGFVRLARERAQLFQASFLAALVPGPILFLWSRPAPDPASPAQAAAWGLCALGLAVPFLWGAHRSGVRTPRARALLALLLPLSLAARLPTAARTGSPLRDRVENKWKALPPGALLWDTTEPGALSHGQWLEGTRLDVGVARRPATAWGRAEYARRQRWTEAPAASAELFFLQAAAAPGPDRIFTDDPARLPTVDPATGLLIAGEYPTDALPAAGLYQFLPADSHRLVSPAAQLSVSRLPLWALRTGDPLGLARAHMALAQKFDAFQLSDGAKEEALAALAYDPGLPEAHRRLGEAALAEGKPARALYHFGRALKRAPRSTALWSLRGRAARAADDPREALQAYGRALAAGSSLPEDRRAHAELLEHAARWKAAADQWRRLSDQNPQEPLYPWRLAKAEAAAGRPRKARNALNEYLMFPLDPAQKEEAEAFENTLKDAP